MRDLRALQTSAGFTLIELLIVIAILGLVIAMVGISGTPVSPATHARAAAREIAGALRAARSEAIVSARNTAFTLDVANRNYRWGQQPVQAVPSELQLSLVSDRAEVLTGNIAKIRFYPDGSSSGGQVSIAGGDRVWQVGIDWISGRVSLAELRR